MSKHSSISIKPTTIVLMTVVAIFMVATAAGKPHKKNVSEADVRKADYIFLESQRLKQQEKSDAYYELVSRAYELNPNDKYLGMEVGVSRMMLSEGDSAELENGLAMLADYAYSNPQDLYN